MPNDPPAQVFLYDWSIVLQLLVIFCGSVEKGWALQSPTRQIRRIHIGVVPMRPTHANMNTHIRQYDGETDTRRDVNLKDTI